MVDVMDAGGAGSAEGGLRAVFDTNVVLSALVFTKGPMASFRLLWRQAVLKPVVSKPVVQELLRVLAYPKFHLTAQDREELLADYLPHAEVVEIAGRSPVLMGLPVCRDAKDQKFLELAQVGGVDFLVTGDADLLVLADSSSGDLSFAICAPADMLRMFED